MRAPSRETSLCVGVPAPLRTAAQQQHLRSSTWAYLRRRGREEGGGRGARRGDSAERVRGPHPSTHAHWLPLPHTHAP